jgi:DNA invertase Pin-like site-specific DNA recombinase
VYAEYVDPGHTGRTENRPAFQALAGDALAGRFQAVLVHKFDRFARSRAVSATYKELLRKNGVRVISITEPTDDTPTSIIVEGMLEVVAEWYSVNLAQETRKGQWQVIRDGGWPGPVTWGYEKDENGWIRLAEDAELVRSAFREFATGNYTLAEWVEVAFAMGYRTRQGNKINKGRWSQIFHNRFYIGIVAWGGVEAQGKHAPLVDEETFNRVQEILAEHDGHKERSTRRPYPLTGFLWSLDANSPLHGAVGKGIRYYRSLNPGDSGQRHHVQAETLESQIAGVLCAVHLPDCTAVHNNQIDGALLLALKVTPTVGDLYQWLETDEQRRAICELAIVHQGLKVRGDRIVDIQPSPPFAIVPGSTDIECPGVDSNHHAQLGTGPQPAAYANSATGAHTTIIQ